MMRIRQMHAAVLTAILSCVAATSATAAIPNPVRLALSASGTGSATCWARGGSVGTWVRVTGVHATLEPSVFDEQAGSKTPGNAMLYCHDRAGHVGQIKAHPANLVYPSGTLVQPVYLLTITRPAGDGQPPFDVELGPGGRITQAPFGHAIIFSKHSMVIVPEKWTIQSRAFAILPKRPGAFTSTLDEGGCEVNRMDDEDQAPRYIGMSAQDCSINVDLNALQ
jgi:hypothetical protein